MIAAFAMRIRITTIRPVHPTVTASMAVGLLLTIAVFAAAMIRPAVRIAMGCGRGQLISMTAALALEDPPELPPVFKIAVTFGVEPPTPILAAVVLGAQPVRLPVIIAMVRAAISTNAIPAWPVLPV